MQLTQGKIRAAEKVDGQWVVNAWVKQGILLGFRLGELSEMAQDATPLVCRQRHLPCPPVRGTRSSACGSRRIVGEAEEPMLRLP